MRKNDNDSHAASFGRYLMAARLAGGISLRQVSEETRISTETLALVESEAHSNLPAAVFVKGFLRSYARAVGADGEKAVRLYHESLDTSRAAHRSETELEEFQHTFWRRVLLIVALLLGIVVLSVYADLLFHSTPSTGRHTAPPTKPPIAEPVENGLETAGPDAPQGAS